MMIPTVVLTISVLSSTVVCYYILCIQHVRATNVYLIIFKKMSVIIIHNFLIWYDLRLSCIPQVWCSLFLQGGHTTVNNLIGANTRFREEAQLINTCRNLCLH